jgi:dsDNA-specific endonuclease/ATPase MutS2
MRLCNPKTKNETGYDFVAGGLFILTPYGHKRLKAVTAFEPGHEEELREELDRLEKTVALIKEQQDVIESVKEILRIMKDNSFTIKRSKGGILSVVELYEIKSLLLQMERIRGLLESSEAAGIYVPEAFMLIDLGALLDVLDPNRERIDTFYLYDSFSEKLADLREQKRRVELDIRRIKKEQKRQLESVYGISMTPKFEYLVSKSDKQLIERVSLIPELILTDEDYMTAVFGLRSIDSIDRLMRDMDALAEAIEDEELSIREKLSAQIGEYGKQLFKNCEIIGELDLNIAKAEFSKQHNCVKPEIVKEHILEIKEGRQLMLEDILRKQNKDYCPVSIGLKEGVTCITGANMGGKTITLKMIGQCALLAQHGFFVPCSEARIGLSGYIHILIGDSQNLKRGLSSFGSEMEELKDILDHSKERSLLLIDEIASGTNPVEGYALTKSIIGYLSEKAYISLVTTHYDNVSSDGRTRNMQVRGLKDVNFINLEREIRYANRRERIEIIGKYMDYRLYEVSGNEEIPKDALNIAQMLGLSPDIIKQAKKIMEDRKDEK